MSEYTELSQLKERTKLITELKTIIIEALNLTINPAHLHNDEILLGGNLGLDSIDALQLVITINTKMNVEIAESEMHVMRSINTIADYIEKKRKQIPADLQIPNSYLIENHHLSSEYNALRNKARLAIKEDLAILKLTDISEITKINDVFSRDIELIPENTIKTVLLLNEDGALSSIVYVYNNFDHYFIVLKKSSKEQVVHYLQSRCIPFEDLSDTFCLLSLSGPASIQIVEEKVGLTASRLGLLSFTSEIVDGAEVIISRQDSIGEFEFLIAIDRTKQQYFMDYLQETDQIVVGSSKEIAELLALESGSFFSRISKNPDLIFNGGLGVLLDKDKEFIGSLPISKLNSNESLIYFILHNQNDHQDFNICQESKILSSDKQQIGYIDNIIYSELIKKYIGTAHIKLDYAHSGMNYSIQTNRAEIPIKTVSAPIVIGKSYLNNGR